MQTVSNYCLSCFYWNVQTYWVYQFTFKDIHTHLNSKSLYFLTQICLHIFLFNTKMGIFERGNYCPFLSYIFLKRRWFQSKSISKIKIDIHACFFNNNCKKKWGLMTLPFYALLPLRHSFIFEYKWRLNTRFYKIHHIYYLHSSIKSWYHIYTSFKNALLSMEFLHFFLLKITNLKIGQE